MSSNGNEQSIAGGFVRGVAIGLALGGVSWIGAAYPIIPAVLWAIYYHIAYLDGQEAASNYTLGYHPQLTDMWHLTGPLKIWDGPLGKINHFDAEWTLFMLACLGVIGFALGRWRWALGMLVVWGPLLTLADWEFYVGKAKYYPGGTRGYIVDHYSQSCAHQANGDLLLDANRMEICRIYLVKKPPF